MSAADSAWTPELEREIREATHTLLDSHLDVSGLFGSPADKALKGSAKDTIVQFRERIKAGVVPEAVLELSRLFLGSKHGPLVVVPRETRSWVIGSFHSYARRLFDQVQTTGVPLPLFAHIGSLPGKPSSEPPLILFVRTVLPILRFIFVALCFFFDTIIRPLPPPVRPAPSASVSRPSGTASLRSSSPGLVGSSEGEGGRDEGQNGMFDPRDLILIADTFSFLEFIAIDLPVVRMLYAKLFRLISNEPLALDQLWHAIPKPIAHFTIVQKRPLSDPSIRTQCCESVDRFLTRTSFFLFGLSFVMSRLSDDLLENQVLPLMFLCVSFPFLTSLSLSFSFVTF